MDSGSNSIHWRPVSSFLRHTSTLQSREHELRELAHILEDRVEIRTQELAAANAKLLEIDRRKSIFISTASHELRTPLTSMKVHLANLRDGIDGAVTDDQRRSLMRVESNLSRLRILIDDLLDFSQIEMDQATARLEPVALGSLITKTVEDLHPFSSERRVSIVISPPSDLPLVCADPDKLRQILLNLLHNAVKFTPVGTLIDLTVMRLSVDEIQISVHDVGPGIAPDDRDKIFQPFYRAPTAQKKTKGAGLGLAIVKRLVELHCGKDLGGFQRIVRLRRWRLGGYPSLSDEPRQIGLLQPEEFRRLGLIPNSAVAIDDRLKTYDLDYEFRHNQHLRFSPCSTAAQFGIDISRS